MAMKHEAVKTKNPSGGTTIYVGGPFWHSATRPKGNRIWRCDRTLKPIGKFTIKQMIRKMSYSSKEDVDKFPS